LTILWTDYFKPEHVEQHPNVGDLFWKTMKLTSTVKQQTNMQAAQDLLAGCQQIAEIFWKTKGVATRRIPSHQTAGGEYVVPA
jgi:nickel superoxide dismutase